VTTEKTEDVPFRRWWPRDWGSRRSRCSSARPWWSRTCADTRRRSRKPA